MGSPRTERATEFDIDIPSYRLLERLGEGTYGTVYRARHERTGLDVAIKILRPGSGEFQSLRRIARFRREMELCARLDHPHVVRLLDRGDGEGGAPWAAFEHVEGTTLQEHLRGERTLPPELLKTLMCQILEALSYAHSKGVVHRDLKPANIMVRVDRDQAWAKVLDFGVGAFLDGAPEGREALTMTAETVGTPSYAAPEQLRGETASARSDLYSWGLVVLECVTGRPVMAGASLAETVHRQLLSEEIQLPQAVARHPLGALLRRVLAKRAEDRAPDASQVLAEFRRIRMDDLVGCATEPSPDATSDERTADGMLARSEVRSLVVACCGATFAPAAEVSTPVETLDRISRARRTLALDVAARYGGWCAGTLGDLQLFYFGYPVPTGQEARLAGRFALELAAENAALDAGEARASAPVPEFRCAIHAGLVEVERGEAPTGATATRALMLASSAPAGAVVVTAEARSRMARHLETEPVTGAEGRLHRLLRAADERIETEDATAPLAGRDGELARLREGWVAARNGAGRAFLVGGEAGMGKSALVEAACASFRLEGADVLQSRCLPENRNAALHPVLELLRKGLGVALDEAPESQARRWNEAVRGSGRVDGKTAATLLQWLALPPVGELPPDASPRDRKERLFAALEEVLLRTTDASRVVVLEDLHWADPTTLEFLARMMPAWRGRGGLLLATARPEFDAPVLGDQIETIALAGLDEASSQRLLDRAFGRGRLHPQVARRLHERAGGSPLFLETLVDALSRAAAGSTGTVDELLADTVLRGIPSGLMDLLALQVDSTGPAAETARLASVLGRQWDDALLERTSPLDRGGLRSDLATLVRAGVLVRGAGGHAFRHALLRDAAYASMAPSRRREYHELAVRAVEGGTDDGSRLALARHCAGAGRHERAVGEGGAVVSSLLARSDLLEAVRLSLEVLEWMDQLGTDAPADARLSIHNALTQALMGVRGWADASVREQIELSRRLLQDAADSPHYGSVLCALMTFHYVSSNRGELACVAEELLRHAERVGDADLRIAATMFLGLWAHGAGRFDLAAARFEEVLRDHDPALHAGHAARFGLDSRAWTAATHALVLWHQDRPEEARRVAAEAVAWAKRIEHVPSIGIALLYQSNLLHYADDRAAAREVVDELMALADKHGMPAFQAYGTIMGSWLSDDSETALGVVATLESMGCTAALSYYRSLVAEVHARQGRWNDAIAGVETCLALCERLDERYYQAPLLVLLARCLRGAGPEGSDRARASLEEARRIARDNGLVRVSKEVDALLDP